MSLLHTDSARSIAARKRQSPEARREEFIRKATQIFAEEGFGASTRDLARRLGVTQPLLYRYFPSKDDLIETVYEHVYLDRWRPEWDALLVDRKQPLQKRLQIFYEAYTDAIFSREWIRIYLFSGLRGVPINRRYIGVVESRVLTRIISEFKAEVGLPDSGPKLKEFELAWLLHGGIFYHGVRKHIYESKVSDDKTEVIADALELFFVGLRQILKPTPLR